jgi:hypothetical protein
VPKKLISVKEGMKLKENAFPTLVLEFFSQSRFICDIMKYVSIKLSMFTSIMVKRSSIIYAKESKLNTKSKNNLIYNVHLYLYWMLMFCVGGLEEFQLVS